MMYELETEHIQLIKRGIFRLDDLYLGEQISERMGKRAAHYLFYSMLNYSGHKDEYGDYEMFDVIVRRKSRDKGLALAFIQPRGRYDDRNARYDESGDYMYDENGNVCDRYAILFSQERKLELLSKVVFERGRKKAAYLV